MAKQRVTLKFDIDPESTDDLVASSALLRAWFEDKPVTITMPGGKTLEVVPVYLQEGDPR